MRRSLVLVVALACLATPAEALANNDNWRSAEDLFFASPGLASTTSYTVEPIEPLASTGCPRMGATAWWRIKGNGQQITLSTEGSGTNFDTVLAVMQGTPESGSRIACNDDAPGDGVGRSRLMFSSTLGASYLIQVGGRDFCAENPNLTPCPRKGNVVLHASSLRPVNDDRAAPAALSTDAPLTTRNVGASLERDEIATCGTSQFEATVWYRWTAPGIGDATFSSTAAFENVAANKSDTVLGVYRADSGVRVGCADDLGQPFGPSALTARVTAGDYLLQVGAHTEGLSTIGQGNVEAKVSFAADSDNDGASGLTDCNDGDAGIRPGAPEVAGNGVDEDCNGVDAPLDPVAAAAAADRDRDGFPRGVDCDDNNPAVNPGAFDRPQDGVNQDCVGRDAPYPRLAASILGEWENFAEFTRFTSLAVKRVAARTKLTLTCKGPGCTFKSKTRRVRKAKPLVNLLSVLKRAKLEPGAKLQIRVTKRRHIGLVTTWKIRSPSSPRRANRCLVPGRKRPKRC